MSRFRGLSHAIGHCQYHIVWVPKYRYRVLKGAVGLEVERCIHACSDLLEAEVVELNVREVHVHLLAIVPPKVSISEFMGTLKGRTAFRVFDKFRHLKHKPYSGNYFWTGGYCVDTVGLDADKIRKYVNYQEDKEKRTEG